MKWAITVNAAPTICVRIPQCTAYLVIMLRWHSPNYCLPGNYLRWTVLQGVYQVQQQRREPCVLQIASESFLSASDNVQRACQSQKITKKMKMKTTIHEKNVNVRWPKTWWGTNSKLPKATITIPPLLESIKLRPSPSHPNASKETSIENPLSIKTVSIWLLRACFSVWPTLHYVLLPGAFVFFCRGQRIGRSCELPSSQTAMSSSPSTTLSSFMHVRVFTISPFCYRKNDPDSNS